MPFGSLWLPVIVSAVVVFVASAILHMALKYHKSDYLPLANEDAVREALSKGNPAPGVYMTPRCNDMKQLKEPAVKEKFDKGPVAVLTVLPRGIPNMGKSLTLWFVFCFLVSFTAAYVARHTLQAGAEGLQAMRVTGSVAFAAYCLSQLDNPIWRGQPWSTTITFLCDGAVYALLTGLIFLFMWPAA